MAVQENDRARHVREHVIEASLTGVQTTGQQRDINGAVEMRD